MSYEDEPNAMDPGSLDRLRHDLLNPLNVLLGTTAVLLEGPLGDEQRRLIRTCRSSAERVLEIVNRLESYHGQPLLEGRARLVDLCSIAVARIDKPFDRHTLVDTLRRLTSSAAPRVLLVDDSPEMASLVRAYLQGSGASIDVVPDGEQAVAQAASHSYDVVLMDIDLPGMDGATAAHAIRTADLARGASPTPIVAVSAFGAGLPPFEEQAPPPSAAAVADAEPVHMGVDPEIAPLIPEYLEHRRGEVHTLQALLERRDFAAIQSLAHNLKGTGRSYGFPALSRLGGSLEDAAHAAEPDRIAHFIAQLDSYLAQQST